MKKFCFVFCLVFLCLFVSPVSSDAALTSLTFPDRWDIGQPFVIALSSREPFQEPSVVWQGRTIPLDVERGRKGYVSYALLGLHVRDARPGNHPLVVDFSQDGREFRVQADIYMNYRRYPEQRLTVAQNMVTPPASENERIQREARLARAARETMTVNRRWTTPPYRPVPGVVTSPYGFRRFFNNVPRAPHAGVDLRAATGAPVMAMFAGRVVLTGEHFFAGGSIYIDSGNGVITEYFHLSEMNVREGDQVAKGQLIGRAGATGRVTGPHLHLGLNLAGQHVDPMPLFDTSITQMLNTMRTATVRE